MLSDDAERLQQLAAGTWRHYAATRHRQPAVTACRKRNWTWLRVKMQEWQELWDQFRREFHQVHEAAQIENRGIEHIERQVQRTDQQRARLQQELENLDSSAAIREITVLEASVAARGEEYAATMAQAQKRMLTRSRPYVTVARNVPISSMKNAARCRLYARPPEFTGGPAATRA